MGGNGGDILQTNTLFERSGITIETDKRGLVCYFSYTPSSAMPKLSTPVIKAALSKAGVKFGIIDDEISNLNGREEEIRNLVIARGERPLLGSEPRLEYLFSTNPYGDFKKAKSEDEKLDYRDRGTLPFVRKGDTVARIIMETDPKPGKSVLGTPIEPEFREAMDVEPGKNVRIDGQRLVAQIDGAPRLDKEGNIEIVSEWTVGGDVDMRTGNIIYPGNLRIKGVIQPGYEVSANSIICEGIENKTVVTTKGKLIVDGGIQGGVINCEGRLEGRFANNASITCHNDIEFRLSVINCDVRTSGSFSAQTIFGGTIAARKGVTCVNLSSEANRSTVIFGVDPIKQKNISELVRKKIEVEEHMYLIREKMGDDFEYYEKFGKMKANYETKAPERETLKARRDATDKDNESALEFFDMRLEELAAELDPIEEKIKLGTKRFELIEKKWMNELMEIAKLKKTLLKLEEEQSEIKETDDTPGAFVPKVTVKGKALIGTRLSSSRARLVLKKEFQRVVFAQRRHTDPEQQRRKSGGYYMSVERL